ncbi:MAG: FAD:protein FMN transferase [Clostridia bacterium]|nr:FAD:protein FMN transferase [Clostridia bacterium]
MKKICCLFFTILFSLLSLGTGACTTKGDSYSLTSFGSPVYIEVYDKTLTEQVKEEISSLLLSLENEFSVSNENSVVYKLNNGLPYTLSNRAIDVFALSKEYWAFTDAKFNPAVYPLNELWCFGVGNQVEKEDFIPPTQDKIDQILQSNVLDFSAFIIENNQVIKNPNQKIDLGGMLKGYACDLVMNILLDNGYTSGYVSMGNSSICLLKAEKLALRHPLDKSKLILTLDTSKEQNASVSTSGDYEKYYDYDGKRYSHIIDANVGKPYDTGIKSATVICKDGAFADALTTALCLSNYNTNDINNCELTHLIKKILEKYPDASVYAIYERDGVKKIITNEQVNKDFSLLDHSFSIVNI